MTFSYYKFIENVKKNNRKGKACSQFICLNCGKKSEIAKKSNVW